MRVKVLKDQSTVLCDTLARLDPSIIVLQALEATPVFIDQERQNLDGNIDGANTPGGGFFLTNAMPPQFLSGAKCKLWCRAATETFIEVQVIEQRFEVNTTSRTSMHQPTRQTPVTKSLANYGGDSNFASGRRY